MVSVKKEIIKAIVCFIKVAIEQDSVVPSFFMAPVTQVQPINGNSGHPNRDLKDNFESDVETPQKEISETR
jgi:hypothetical protein